MRAQTLVYRARFSVRESGAPWHLTPSLQASGAFAEDPDEAGGVVTVEDGSPRCRRHSVDIRGWRRRRRCARTPHVHGGKAQPRPATHRGEASHMQGAPSRARTRTGAVDHDDTHVVAHVAANVGHAHWEAAELTRVSHTRRFAAEPTEGLPKCDGSMARDWLARLGRTSPTDSGAPSRPRSATGSDCFTPSHLQPQPLVPSTSRLDHCV